MAIWKGSHNPLLRGRKRSPWLLTTYPSHGMILQAPGKKSLSVSKVHVMWQACQTWWLRLRLHSSCHDSLNLSILNGSTKVIHSHYKNIHNNTFIHSKFMFGTRSTKSWIELQTLKKPHDMLWIYVPLKPSHDPKWEGDTGDCCFKLFHIILVVVYISGWHSSSKPWKIL